MKEKGWFQEINNNIDFVKLRMHCRVKLREPLIMIQRGSYKAEGFIQLVSCLVYLTHAEARNHMDNYQMKNKNRYK